MILANLNYSGASASPFFAINSAGDSTKGGAAITFAQQAVVMPMACTVNTLYVFQQVSSGSAVSVTLYKSAGGTGVATSTGLSVTASNGGGNHATGAVAVAAGDTLAYGLTGAGVGSGTTVLSAGLLCQ
jgi:hypothetical protein